MHKISLNRPKRILIFKQVLLQMVYRFLKSGFESFQFFLKVKISQKYPYPINDNNNSQMLFPLFSRHHQLSSKMRLLLLALALLVTLVDCSPLHGKSSDKTQVASNKRDEVQQKEKRCKYIDLLCEWLGFLVQIFAEY